jgi:hypothetical protein
VAERLDPSPRGCGGVRGSDVGRDGVESATRGDTGDVDGGVTLEGVPGVVVSGDDGVDPGVDAVGDDDSTGGGVVDVASVAGFPSVGGALGSLDVPGVDDDGELLSGAPG